MATWPLDLVTALVLVSVTVVVYVVPARRRNRLTGVAALVTWGALVVLAEHAQFAVSYALSFDDLVADATVRGDHARVHFFMAGMYAALGHALLVLIAWTRLVRGDRVGWWALAAAAGLALMVEPFAALALFPHGNPLVAVVGLDPVGSGWVTLATYMGAWTAALCLAWRPVFRPATGTSTRLAGAARV